MPPFLPGVLSFLCTELSTRHMSERNQPWCISRNSVAPLISQTQTFPNACMSTAVHKVTPLPPKTCAQSIQECQAGQGIVLYPTWNMQIGLGFSRLLLLLRWANGRGEMVVSRFIWDALYAMAYGVWQVWQLSRFFLFILFDWLWPWKSGGFKLHWNDWQTVGICTQFQEWSSWLLPAFLFHVVSEKRLLSSPPFTVTLTYTAVHHEFRFLFMFNLKSVSVCSNLFNAEYMNKFNFALSTTKLWTHECTLHHKGCLYFYVANKKASESHLYLEITQNDLGVISEEGLLLWQKCIKVRKQDPFFFSPKIWGYWTITFIT